MIINLSKIDFANTGGGGSASLQEKNFTITANGDTPISPDEGYDGISGGTISVNVTNPPTAYDINSPFVSLAYYTGTSVPSEIVGWENLTDGSNKCRSGNLTNWNIELPELTSGDYMFQYNYLTSWDIELPKLTDGTYMFNYCSKLSSFTSDLSPLTNGNNMFGGCSSLTSFTSNLSSLTNGISMFQYCSGLTNWNIELPNLINGGNMFNYCSKLSSFTSDLSKLTSITGMFRGCSGLTNVTLTGTLNCNNLDFSDSTALTVDSLVNIISVLVDRTGQSRYTLTLGSTNLGKLTDEQKAVATNKNWILN